MFEHSIKVPRHFKIAANIVKKVSEEGGSVKTLLYDNKLKHFRTSVLYALINESIKHASNIEKIFENTGILVNEPRLDPWLAKVLTAELLYGKGALPGKSKPEQTILTYKEQFEKCTSELQDNQKSKGANNCSIVVRRPRYVRINTNLLTTSDAIRSFQDEGYKFIRCTSGSYNDYLQQIQNLSEYDFTQDYHVKTIFVFSPGTKLHEHDLYLENKIILQDKATALAVHLLAAPAGSVVLDMCAAPGMKTTQLAAYLRNQGKIYAVERNEKRYETLCQYVEATGSKCVQTFHKDSLEIKRGDMDDVEYILLDPSCSGSGMELSVHSYIDQTRLAKLTSLQEKFLKHAMNSFPNAKRIVYSTCSIFPEENERVVTNIVKASRAKWRVKDVKELLKEQWNNFGSGMYGSMGTRCLYAKSDSDFTTGFFLAVLDRDLREVEKSVCVDEKCKHAKSKDVNDVQKGHYEKENNQKYQKNKKKNRSDSIRHNAEGMSTHINENNSLVPEDTQLNDCQRTDILEEKCEFPNYKKKKQKHKAKEMITHEEHWTEIILDIINDKKGDSTNENTKIKENTSDVIKNKQSSCEYLEILESSAQELKAPKKKKKKRKENEKLPATLDTANNIENIECISLVDENVDISNDLKAKKKKATKRNKSDNQSIVVNDVNSNKNGIVSRSKKSEIFESQDVTKSNIENNSEHAEIIQTYQSDNINNDDYKEPKIKKKKRKVHDTEESATNSINTIDLSNNEDIGVKKSKKKRIAKPDSQPEISHQEEKRDESINFEISAKDQSYKRPKKKKKKGELHTS